MDIPDVQRSVLLLNKPVKVTIKYPNEEVYGTVHTIDPVSHNVILLTKDANQEPQLQIIMKQAIQDIAILETNPEDKQSVELFNKGQSLESQSNASLDDITDWLHRNRVEFGVKDGWIEVEGVSIHPPYRPQDCMGSNVIVLGRVQKLLADRTAECNFVDQKT